MRKIKQYCFLLFIFLNHCKNENAQYSPVFKVLESEIDKGFIRNLENSKEKDVLSTFFENFLFEYKKIVKKNNEINLFFLERELKEEPEQAYVLLLLWYRKLSNKRLNMPELIKMAGDKRIGISSCKIIRRINAVDNFIRLNLGDKVGLNFPDSDGSGEEIKSAAFFDCPTIYWDFDIDKDIYIEGGIVNKYGKATPEEYFIQVKIAKMNDKNSLFFYKPIQVGDTIEVNLVGYGMKISPHI